MGHLKKMNIDIKEIIESHLDTAKSLLNDLDNIKYVCDLSYNTIANNRKIILCGNGGSAAIANHYICDFFKQLSKYTNLKAKIRSFNSDYYFRDNLFLYFQYAN